MKLFYAYERDLAFDARVFPYALLISGVISNDVSMTFRHSVKFSKIRNVMFTGFFRDRFVRTYK